jgi:hypothetical protein
MDAYSSGLLNSNPAQFVTAFKAAIKAMVEVIDSNFRVDVS